jgi:hypothetical protein
MARSLGQTRSRIEPDSVSEPAPLPPYAALCRDLQGRERKYASFLALGSVFEPEIPCGPSRGWARIRHRSRLVKALRASSASLRSFG